MVNTGEREENGWWYWWFMCVFAVAPFDCKFTAIGLALYCFACVCLRKGVGCSC